MADDTVAEPGPAGGDGARGRRPGPRTRVDRRFRGRRDDAAEGTPDPASPLDGRPGVLPPTRVDPGAPTKVRPDAPTRVAPDTPTRVTPRGPAPETVTQRPAPSRGGHFGGAFPAALLGRYEPYGVAGSGTEGTVWHVRRVDGGGEAAVKVTVAGQAVDAELLDHLRNDAYRRHVPQIFDYGRVEHAGAGCDWVAMEYLPVTLADHVAGLRREGRHADGPETDRIVHELVALLDFWQQQIRRNPIDFKPANILVRPGGRPGDFVIADFGGVARLTASRSFSPEMQVTIAYMAPEQLAGTNHPAGPWWALGNVLYELFTGRPRYLGADGMLVSDEVLQYDLVMGDEVDLSAVTDPRRLLLLQGLFTKNPAQRWTAGQVRSWLAGGSPEVARHRMPTGPSVTPEPRPAHRPITFLGDPYHDPSVLASAMLGRSADAAYWLAGDGAERVLAWLRDDVQDTVFDLHHLRDVERTRGAKRSRSAALAVLALGAAFAPAATPHYNNRPIDTAGLARISTEADAVAFLDELVASSAPAIAARYHCDHPECHGEQCARLLALTQLPAVLAEVERTARALGGGPRTAVGPGREPRGGEGRGREAGGEGLSAHERDGSYRLALRLTILPEEHAQLLGRLSPLPAALYLTLDKALLPVPAARTVTVVAATVVDAALAARAAMRPDAADKVRRSWSGLRRRALRADPGTVPGRAMLVAAAVLRARGARAARAARDRGPLDRQAMARAWWAGARTALPRRAGAALLMLIALALMLWSGAVWRFGIDAGTQVRILPNGPFGGPLRTVGEHAARQVVGQLGAALAAAVTAAVFPARIGRWTLAVVAAAAFAIGYLRLGPPMTVLRPPQALADRVVVFEGGMGSWAGVAATLAVVLTALLIERSATRMLKPAHDARRGTAEEWQRLAAARRRPSATDRPEPERDAKKWRPGPEGVRDRALFALGSTVVLTVLLWATVEVRLASTGHHPNPASWGTGQTGAAYQAGFLLLLAALSVLSTLATPQNARRLFVGWLLGTLVLGSWPPPLGPLEAVRIPVAQPLFGGLAELWGHSAFWAALLIALPIVGYGVLRTLRRTRR
ncbi:hypothetical protein [Kitasatospora sp. NPDC050543]|uniref:protein kinase domain-containing protein n=1 Tax=Kitasatospora sp. NPDC050543 TaxID=3364054 RepID=UPI00379E9505